MTDRPPARRPSRRGLKAVRRLLGQKSSLELQSRSMMNLARYRSGKPIIRSGLFAVHNGGGEKFGILGVGACDVQSVLAAGPSLGRMHSGPLCIYSGTPTSQVRSDLILQTLDPPPREATREVIERLNLQPDYFAPTAFEPGFTPRNQAGIGSFPTKVVVLSVSTDAGRSIYRHREHGFKVDPGGWWLDDKDDALDDLERARWFGTTFKKLGRINVDESMDNYRRLITAFRERLGAFVVLLNVLTVDPGKVALDYQHANSPNRLRRREFVLALADLAREMDFPVLDIDRLTKEVGISAQADFVHYTAEQRQLIGAEFAKVIVEAGLIGDGTRKLPSSPRQRPNR